MGHSSLPELPWVAPGFLARWQSQPRSRPSPPRLPQGTDVYVGKHRSALLRAGQGLAALRARLQQLAQVMSLPATSIAAALADRVPDGQLGPDARRHLKSSLGMDLRKDREKGVKVLWLLGAPSWPLAWFWHHKRVAVAVSHGAWVLGRVRDNLQPAEP